MLVALHVSHNQLDLLVLELGFHLEEVVDHLQTVLCWQGSLRVRILDDL